MTIGEDGPAVSHLREHERSSHLNIRFGLSSCGNLNAHKRNNLCSTTMGAAARVPVCLFCLVAANFLFSFLGFS